MSNLSSNGMSVFAVVVTFNRPNVLRNCIESLCTQVPFGLRRIHVVVNSSDADTKLFLESYASSLRLLTYEFLDNPGPAGGFHVGLQKFLSESHTHVWLMDDDVIIKNDCLKEMLSCAETGDYVRPTVISHHGVELNSYGWWAVLLSRSVIERVGLPLTGLFYWIEDTEYLQHRINRVHKIVPIACKGAVVNHLHARDQKRPSWYYYYVVRNTLFYRIYVLKFTWHHFKRISSLLRKSVMRIVLKEDHKLKKFRLMLFGMYHGLIGKIGKLVDPALNK